MKKHIMLVFIFVFLISLTGCVKFGRQYWPADYPGSIWETKDQSICFEVDEKRRCYGTLQTKDGSTDIYIRFSYASYMEMYPASAQKDKDSGVEKGATRLLIGACRFYPSKFTVKVEKSTFAEEGEKLVFYRIDQ